MIELDDNQPRCESCGEPFTNHAGVQKLCAEVKRLTAELQQAWVWKSLHATVEADNKRLTAELDGLKATLAIEYEAHELTANTASRELATAREAERAACELILREQADEYVDDDNSLMNNLAIAALHIAADAIAARKAE